MRWKVSGFYGTFQFSRSCFVIIWFSPSFLETGSSVSRTVDRDTAMASSSVSRCYRLLTFSRLASASHKKPCFCVSMRLQSSSPITAEQQFPKPAMVKSTAEWEHVERLLPPRLIPAPPAEAYERLQPSGWKMPSGERPRPHFFPFFVRVVPRINE